MKFETQSQALKFAFLGGWKNIEYMRILCGCPLFFSASLPAFFFCSYKEYTLWFRYNLSQSDSYLWPLQMVQKWLAIEVSISGSSLEFYTRGL